MRGWSHGNIEPVSPEVREQAVRTMEQVISGSVAQPRFTMLLVGSFAFATALLALLGIRGVVSYAVRRRVHELSLWIALGARGGETVRLVLRQGIVFVLAGIGIGVVAALGAECSAACWSESARPTHSPTPGLRRCSPLRQGPPATFPPAAPAEWTQRCDTERIAL